MRHFFGFTKEPFSPDIKLDELYHSAALEGVKERFLYAVSLGAISVITGDVGSGKSTALRYASGGLHPGTTSSPSSRQPAASSRSSGRYASVSISTGAVRP